MKLLNMHVDNFGGLHDYTCNFDEGLNVILEDNGWGKTTMAAFLKAMLYGFESGLSKDIKENERRRYYPWQGGTYGGTLDFEADGVRYRVKRTFGENPRFDSVKITNLDTDTPVRITADSLGEELFKLDAGAFQRSVFINQNSAGSDGSAAGIQARLNALVSQANNTAAYDNAIGDLSQLVRTYEKNDGRGQLDTISRSLAEKQTQKDLMEREIREQEDARIRVSDIGNELETLGAELEEQKLAYDQAVSDRQRLEASNKLLSDVNEELGVLQDQQDRIRAEFGGSVPESDAIEETRTNIQTIASMDALMTELSGDRAVNDAEYQKIAGRYEGAIPEPSRMDEIQQIYSELQTIRAASKEDADRMAEIEEPAGYTAVAKALQEDNSYTDTLKEVIQSKNSVQELIRMRDFNTQSTAHETESWAATKKRYTALTDEIQKHQDELERMQAYNPSAIEAPIRHLNELLVRRQDLEREKKSLETVLEKESADWETLKKKFAGLREETEARQKVLDDDSPAVPERIRPRIEKLVELQKLEQAIKIKQEAIDRNRITEEEKGILNANTGDLPEAGEADRMKERYRSLLKEQQEKQSVAVSITEEQKKADDLNKSLKELEGTELVLEHAPVEEPVKGMSTVFMILGALLIIGGGIAAAMVNPLIAALAVLGLVLLVLGFTGSRKYRQRYQEYQAYITEKNQKEAEADQKKADLRKQIDDVEAGIRNLTEELESNSTQMKDNQKEIVGWVKKYGRNEKQVTEEVISRIGINSDRLRNLRAKSKEIADTKKFIDDETAYIRQILRNLKEEYPETDGMNVDQAAEALRKRETAYQLEAEKLSAAHEAEARFLEESGCTEDQLLGRTPTEPSEVRQKLASLSADFEAVDEERSALDSEYEGLEGLSYETAIEKLRTRAQAYQVTEGQLRAARQNEVRYLMEAGVTRDSLAMQDSEKLVSLKKAGRELDEKFNEIVTRIRKVLAPIGIEVNRDNVVDSLQKAEVSENEYNQYSSMRREQTERETKRLAQIASFEEILSEQIRDLKGNYADEELPKRISLVRSDLNEANHLQEKIAGLDQRIEEAHKERTARLAAVNAFERKFGQFVPEGEDVFTGICRKAEEYNRLQAEMAPLVRQRDAILEEQKEIPDDGGTLENQLRHSIESMETRKEALLAERSQKKELIRQADRSVEAYPDMVREISQLYEQRDAVRSEDRTLKRAIQLIGQAKDNLASRYLGKVEQLFNDYMHIWLGNEAVRGILDVDFNVSIEENDKVHVAEGYSTGYCDLMDFCMRLALIDTLFENEQPFLILDDPFVNLDETHLEKALELLGAMSASRQIVYFVCHPVRAVKAAGTEREKAQFRALAERQKELLDRRIAEMKPQEAEPERSPKDRYQVVEGGMGMSVAPVNTSVPAGERVVRMKFAIRGGGIHPDKMYELFFVDETGTVVSERRLLELRNDRLYPEEVQFRLNREVYTGDRYELMVQETGSDDFDVAARFPIPAAA